MIKWIRGSRQIISYLAGQSRQIGNYLAGHVPPNRNLFGRTVPPNRKLFGGTVPPNSFPLKCQLFCDMARRKHSLGHLQLPVCSVHLHVHGIDGMGLTSHGLVYARVHGC